MTTPPPPDETGGASPSAATAATPPSPPAPDPFDDPAFDAAAYVNALFPNGARAERNEQRAPWSPVHPLRALISVQLGERASLSPPGVRGTRRRRARAPPRPQKKRLTNQCTHSRSRRPPPPSFFAEASLAGLDDAAADLRAKIAAVDGEILDAVRAQEAPAGKAR